MEHNWVQERLADFEEGQLPESQMRTVLQHLEGCPECREALLQWQQTRQAVATLVTPAPSSPFVERVMARVESLPVQTKRWVPEWLYPELGIAAAATILFAIGYFQGSVPVVSTEILLEYHARGASWLESMQQSNTTALEMTWRRS